MRYLCSKGIRLLLLTHITVVVPCFSKSSFELLLYRTTMITMINTITIAMTMTPPAMIPARIPVDSVVPIPCVVVSSGLHSLSLDEEMATAHVGSGFKS